MLQKERERKKKKKRKERNWKSTNDFKILRRDQEKFQGERKKEIPVKMKLEIRRKKYHKLEGKK